MCDVWMGMGLSAFSSGTRARQLDLTPGGRELIIKPEESPKVQTGYTWTWPPVDTGNRRDVVSSGSPRGTAEETSCESDCIILLPTACPGSPVPLGKVQTLHWHSCPVDSVSAHLQPQALLLPRPCLLGSSPTMFFHSRPLHSMFLIPG